MWEGGLSVGLAEFEGGVEDSEIGRFVGLGECEADIWEEVAVYSICKRGLILKKKKRRKKSGHVSLNHLALLSELLSNVKPPFSAAHVIPFRTPRPSFEDCDEVFQR